jgi:hypothetical protein
MFGKFWTLGGLGFVISSLKSVGKYLKNWKISWIKYTGWPTTQCSQTFNRARGPLSTMKQCRTPSTYRAEAHPAKSPQLPPMRQSAHARHSDHRSSSQLDHCITPGTATHVHSTSTLSSRGHNAEGWIFSPSLSFVSRRALAIVVCPLLHSALTMSHRVL